MADLELVRSSQEECEYVHTRLQEYNRPYMDESMDFSFHIEDGGRIVAGIVAESTMALLRSCSCLSTRPIAAEDLESDSSSM